MTAFFQVTGDQIVVADVGFAGCRASEPVDQEGHDCRLVAAESPEGGQVETDGPLGVVADDIVGAA